MDLQVHTKNVRNLFSVSKKYEVPRFQREYSWEKEQILEFWHDVSSNVSLGKEAWKNNEYFIGCIVLTGDESNTTHKIVDGQQRLTTITLFLRALMSVLQSDETFQKEVQPIYDYIEGKDDLGKPYFKLSNEIENKFLKTAIQNIDQDKNKKAKTNEEKKIYTAYSAFKDLLHDGLLENSPDWLRAIRTQVLDYTKVITITTKDEGDAYVIFETLNARGVSLTAMDLIKNWIFKNYPETHPVDEAKHSWEEIKKTSNDDLNIFFRHYWNSKYDFASEGRLYKSFIEAVKEGKITGAKSFLDELKEAVELYNKIANPNPSHWRQIKEKRIYYALNCISLYKVTQVRPFILALFDAYSRSKITQRNLITSLANLDKFHFVFTQLCSSRASGLDGKYTKAAKSVREASTKNDVVNVINNLTNELRGKIPSESVVKEALSNLKYTRTEAKDKRTMQILFGKIELLLRETTEINQFDFSLEHVCDLSNDQEWASGIKNIIPLCESLNNNLGEKPPFEKKLAAYECSDLKCVEAFLNICRGSKNWTEEVAGTWFDNIFAYTKKLTKLENL